MMADFHCVGKEVEVMEELILVDREVDRVSIRTGPAVLQH